MLDSIFIWGDLPVNRLLGRYEWPLVSLSFLIAFFASYVSLHLASQMRREVIPRLKHFWHIGAAIALGTGIWSMHFTGMLAYHLEMEHHYKPALTLISLLLPIFVAYVVFGLIRQNNVSNRTILLISPFLGIGIALMHYVGMAAMDMRATLQYTPGWFLVSLIIAFTASAAGIWLCFIASSDTDNVENPRIKLLAAGALGIAICGLHYSAMQATVIVPFADCRLGPEYDDLNILLAIAVGGMMLLILGIALIALQLNQKLAEHLKEQVARRTEDLERSSEELRAAKEQAEEANLAKSEFLANMSHEIRTPINAVVGIANILNADMLPQEKRKQYLNTLQVSAESLLGLINELLDISKIETNRIELEANPFNLHDLIEEVILLISVRANEKGLKVNLEYDKELPSSFIGDALRVRQILVNIISNAVKFTEQGSITIHVSGSPAKNHKMDVRIRVSDTGIGIATEKLHHIFDKFIQADTSTSRKYGGTGLGLSISRGLAERMDGSITVASQLGKGSEFTVHLLMASVGNVAPTEKTTIMPLTQPAAPAQKDPEEKMVKDAARILLVEDNAANILVAKSYLDIFGYEYAIAHNGQEAVDKHTEHPFDLILMDVQMPVMDGYEATRRIREWEKFGKHPHTPIVAMTSHGRIEDRDRCLREGMDEYISKPFRPEDLRSKIENLLRTHSKAAPNLSRVG